MDGTEHNPRIVRYRFEVIVESTPLGEQQTCTEQMNGQNTSKVSQVNTDTYRTPEWQSHATLQVRHHHGRYLNEVQRWIIEHGTGPTSPEPRYRLPVQVRYRYPDTG